MKAYIGTKILSAYPMTLRLFNEKFIKYISLPKQYDNDEGYAVVYPDGYTSWSPKTVFESAYREVTSEENDIVVLSSDDKIGPKGINS